MGTNENLTKQRAAMTHELKIWPKHIEDLDSGRKTFEIRSTKDRDFRPGDELLLNEYLPKERLYTGRQLRTKILGVHEDVDWLEPDFAILSLDTVQRTGRQWIETCHPNATIKEALDQIGHEGFKGTRSGFVRLPGSEGLAEKVQEIQAGSAVKPDSEYAKRMGWVPPPGMNDPAAIRFGRDAKYEGVPGGNLVAVWVSRKTILEQLGIRELTPQHRVLGEGFVAEELVALREIAALAKDFQDKFRALPNTADSWGLHVADGRLAKALRTQPTEGVALTSEEQARVDAHRKTVRQS